MPHLPPQRARAPLLNRHGLSFLLQSHGRKSNLLKFSGFAYEADEVRGPELCLKLHSRTCSAQRRSTSCLMAAMTKSVAVVCVRTQEKEKEKVKEKLERFTVALLADCLDLFDIPRGAGEEAKKVVPQSACCGAQHHHHAATRPEMHACMDQHKKTVSIVVLCRSNGQPDVHTLLPLFNHAVLQHPVAAFPQVRCSRTRMAICLLMDAGGQSTARDVLLRVTQPAVHER